MIISFLGIFKGCCPWFWKSSAFSEYHKRIGQTQHQSFMRQTIQPSSHQQKSYKSEHSTSSVQTAIPKGHSQKVAQNPVPISSSSSSVQSLVPPQKSYVDCIPLDHPHYALLLPKLHLLPTIFNMDIEPETKIAENNYNLKIFIKQSEDERLNIFVYTFEFETTYEFYQEMQNNFQLQKSFDGNIDKYQCRDKMDENTKVIYLAYKKILIVSPRDFIYVRYTFKKDNQYWAIATSIPNAEIYPGKERGSIVLTATRAIEKDGKLYLTVYSQVDMRMPVKASAAKVRGITEIKKYLDKCYDHVQKQKNSII